MGVCGRADKRLNKKSKWMGRANGNNLNERVTSKNYNAMMKKREEAGNTHVNRTWSRNTGVLYRCMGAFVGQIRDGNVMWWVQTQFQSSQFLGHHCLKAVSKLQLAFFRLELCVPMHLCAYYYTMCFLGASKGLFSAHITLKRFPTTGS